MGASSTNPYTSQTISNYNASPPPDDGTQTVANQLSWSKHKTKLADPIKTLAEGINTAVSATFAKTINTDANVANQISGSLALEWATATIGTDSISPTYSAVLLGTESGATSDTLQVITATGVYNGALLNIRQRNATEEILLVHATSTAATATGANIYLRDFTKRLLNNINETVTLQYDANTASGWVETNNSGNVINTGRATVASAATTADIWGAAGNQIDWTGTTTCTGFPAAPRAGASRTLICAAAAPFTAGANMLIDGVTSGNTVTCAANDIMIVRAVTTTQFRLSRVRYDGNSQLGAPVLLSTVTASNSATVDVETGFSSTYDDYIIIGEGIVPATDTATLQCQLKIGGAYVTTATYYYHVQLLAASANTYSANAGAAVAQIRLSPALDNVNAASNYGFTMDIRNANSTTLAHSLTWRGASADVSANTYEGGTGHGSNAGTGALSGVRFSMSSGNISVGTFRLYGVNK